MKIHHQDVNSIGFQGRLALTYALGFLIDVICLIYRMGK